MSRGVRARFEVSRIRYGTLPLPLLDYTTSKGAGEAVGEIPRRIRPAIRVPLGRIRRGLAGTDHAPYN